MLPNQLRPAIVLTLVLCVLTGVVYPGVVTALAQLLFPRQANGRVTRKNTRSSEAPSVRAAFSSWLSTPSNAARAASGRPRNQSRYPR